MRTRIPFLLALLHALAGAEALDSTAKAAMEAELGRFRAAHSIGYLGKLFFEIRSGEGVEYGFGVLRERTLSLAGDTSGRAASGAEILLNGRSILPERTRMVWANGVPGLPGPRGWIFRLVEGRMAAFSSRPFGNPEWVAFQGREIDLRSAQGRRALGALLAKAPKAHALLDGDVMGAIRAFNAAPGIGSAPEGAAGREPVAAPRGPDPAASLEAQGRWRQANEQLERALRLEPPARLEGLLDRIETNRIQIAYDSAYTSQEGRFLWLEWENGLGLAQGMLGSSLAAHVNVGPSLAASLSLGMGLGQFVPPAARFPAVGLRVFLPGRKFRIYGGYALMNPFRWGSRDRAFAFGPEAGLSHDIGGPRGLKLNYGVSSWIVGRNRPEAGEPARDRSFRPHFTFSYAY